MLSRRKENELSELAETIADLYCPEGIVHPAKIAEIIGIPYCYGNYGDAFDGLIECENKAFHIFINSKNVDPDHPRSRFTFAHELGHYFIDEHRQALLNGRTPSHPSITNFSSKNPVEQEADHFASSLLLPETRMRSDCANRVFNFKLIDDLSTKYQTSITATALKLMTIDKHPLMLVCSVAGEIKWFRHSHDFPFKWLKKPWGVVPRNTLASAYFLKGEKFNNELPITANNWFENVRGRDIDRPFFEKCIYSDRYNFALSIIWES